MACFPFMTDIKNAKALVVGAGKTALAKVRKLAPFGPEIAVVAKEVSSDFETWAEELAIKIARRPFNDNDIDGVDFVVVAVDDSELGRRIAAVCRERRIPVNVVDSPDECSFFFPAIARRGRTTVAVSTDGGAPFAAAKLREIIEDALPDRIEEIVDWFAAVRDRVRATFPDALERRRAFAELWEMALAAGGAPDDAEVERFFEAAADDARVEATEQVVGRVDLVGAGSGDASLITVRGAALLQQCDAVLYDELLDKSLLDLAPKHAARIPVGKRCGRASARQEDICELMIVLAQRGRRVVRLKGGDPFLFGRGGEEAIALRDAGIPYSFVPGVTSATYVPMEAGTPVTHRGLSRSVHIATARATDDGFFKQIREFAQLEGTLVFLMGLERLEWIASELVRAGKNQETPAAVFAGGAAENRYAIRGNLGNIARLAREGGATAPAVIVVGDVAALDLRSPEGCDFAGETFDVRRVLNRIVGLSSARSTRTGKALRKRRRTRITENKGA